MSFLEIDHLSKYYGRKKQVAALDGVSLKIEEGEMLVLLGPSGCGKTTLLRTIAGLEETSVGRIKIGGRMVVDAEAGVAVPSHQRNLGFVFQNYALWPHMTVLDNVAFPLKARGTKTSEAHQRATAVLELVGCETLCDRLPGQLSGGQQQRIALARSLVASPQMVLFDEPLSNVDAQLRRVLRAEIRRLHQELGFTGVYVTHDQQEGLELGDRVAVMRAGKVEQVGTPQEIHDRPVSAYVAAFLGVANRLFCHVEGDQLHTNVGKPDGPWISAMPAGNGSFEMFVRTQALRVTEPGAAINPGACVLRGGTLMDMIGISHNIEYVIQIGNQTLFAIAHPGQSTLKRGQPVDCYFEINDALVYRLENTPAIQHNAVDV